MNCSYCNAEIQAEATHCPGCGRIRDLPDAPASRIILLVVLAVASIGAVAYFAVQRAAQFASRSSVYATSRSQTPRPTRLPVDHGGAVAVEQLTGNGKLYFVPMGRQEIPVSELVAHYESKFNLRPSVLPEVKLTPDLCPADRKQCIAEQLIFAMIRAYPKIAADPDAVMIAITDEDIYAESDDDDFNYSFHFRRHVGVVSSYRAGLDANDKPLDRATKLARTEQVLTKYIAYMYYHVPYSHDPTSIMNQPFTPHGVADDLYESDLHSEYSANGLWGNDSPCLGFHYSYKTGVFSPVSDTVFPCTDMSKDVRSTDDETFETELFAGLFKQRAMDFYLPGSPDVEFRRAYVSKYPSDQAFGVGAEVSYNKWALSDGIDKMSYVDLIHEDGVREHFYRASPGKGFNKDVRFEGSEELQAYGAKMVWEQDHFRINYLDGSTSTILPCDGNAKCYWSGYRDSFGHTLAIQRSTDRVLQSVKSSDGKKVECISDHGRIRSAKDSSGRTVNYEYDAQGHLVKVHRPDGQVAVYTYDRDHNMTSFSVIKHPGAAPTLLLTNEYDEHDRIVRQTLADGRSVTVSYSYPASSAMYRSVVVDLKGTSIQLLPEGSDNGYIAKAQPVRYRALLNSAAAAKGN